MPRDPLAPIAAALADLTAAAAGIELAKAEAKAVVADARERERLARAELHRRMAAAARLGVRQVDIARAAAMTREGARRILRAEGVEATD